MTAPEPTRSYALARHTLRKQPFHAAFVVALAAAAPTAIVQLASGDPFAFVIALAIALVSSFVLFSRRAIEIATLEVEPDALVIRRGGLTRRLSRTHVVAGYRIDETTLMVREANGRENYLRLDRPATGSPPETIDLLLSHLGVALGQRAITVPLRPFLGAFSCGIIAFIPLAVATLAIVGEGAKLAEDLVGHNVRPTLVHFIMGVAMLAPLVGSYLFGKRFGAPQLVIGDDALRILSGFGTQLVRYDSLLRVDSFPAPPESPSGLTIRGRNRSFRTLEMIGQSTPQIEGVVQRIHEAIDRSERLRSTVTASLDRGSRTIAEWRAWLRSSAGAGGGFRDAVFPTETLESLLRDPAAHPEHRVGAAIALRAASTDSLNVQRRIRVAAEASADPRVRVALEAAAADAIEDAALEKALDRARVIADVAR